MGSFAPLLTSQSMWCKDFEAIWKGLILGLRSNWETSNIIQRDFDLGFAEIFEGGWIGQLSAKRRWSWHSMGLLAHWDKETWKPSTGALTLGVASQARVEPSPCPKASSHESSLLSVMGWAGGKRLYWGNNHELHPRTIKMMSFKLTENCLSYPRPYRLSSSTVIGK